MGTGEGVLRSKIKDIFTGTSSSPSESSPPIVDSPAPLDPSPATSTPSTAAIPRVNVQVSTPKVQVKGPAEVMHAAKRTLYTANVGDARAVLSSVLRPLTRRESCTDRSTAVADARSD